VALALSTSYVDGPYWQVLFDVERFGLQRSYVRPFGAAL
jgi:hypothetical protein